MAKQEIVKKTKDLRNVLLISEWNSYGPVFVAEGV